MVRLRTLVDGIESAAVPVTDRGLMYGDGLFETIAVHNGRPCLWAAHMERLRRGAVRLSIPCPPESLLHEECINVIGAQPRCVVKLVVTRGSGGRGYCAPARPRPTRIFSRHQFPNYPDEWWLRGVSVDICRTMLAEQPVLAGLKHLNRLEQVLARSEWVESGRAEGLMCDGRGRVICGTMSNLFVADEAGLTTPRLDSCGIAGTVRSLVLESARRFGVPVIEGDLYLPELMKAKGLFLTNALIGVWPVRYLGEQMYDIRRLPLGFLDWIREAVQIGDAD